MPSPAVRSSPWYERAFDRLYLTVYGHRDEAEARRLAPGVVRLLGVKPHARILDLACGEGRYARALASMGYRVTGVDLSRDLIDEARRQSPLLPGSPPFVVGDMRNLPFVEQFDGAVSLFTSIGYFADSGDDVRIFEGVRRALVPGGRFLVDFLNAAEVRANLVAESVTERPPHRIEIRRRIDEDDPGGPVVVKDVTVVDTRTGHAVGEVAERVRLYSPDDLDGLLTTAGFALVGSRRGDLDGAPFSDASPRLVRVVERPARRGA